MFRLLPLTLVFLVSSFSAKANWVRIDLKFDSKKGAIDIFDSERVGGSRDYQMRLGGRWEEMARYWSSQFNFDAVKRDYSHYLVRDGEGGEVPLSEMFDEQEYSSNVSFSYQKGRDAFDISLAKSLGNTPFSFLSGSIGYDKTFVNKTRTLGLRVSFIDKEQPLSSYIDQETLREKRRPTETQIWRGNARWSEVITDWWKTEVMVLYGIEIEGRPDHYGLEIKNGFGITHEVLLKAHTGMIVESDGELRDDRGRFDMLWVESSLWWELNPDYSMEFLYSFVKERERYSLGRGDAILGTDSYGLKFNYEGVDWLLNVAWVFRNTNIHYQAHELQGGIQWDI